MSDWTEKKMQELHDDAEVCPRLSVWEREFINSMQEKFSTYGDRIRLSDKQLELLDRVERKIHAT